MWNSCIESSMHAPSQVKKRRLAFRNCLTNSALVTLASVTTFSCATDAFPGPPFTTIDSTSTAPWRTHTVQGKPFWFTLGGADGSAVHNATLDKLSVADHGLATCGVGEWEYSFHHLKDGAKDGAGYVHHGGYPVTPRTRAEAVAMVKTYYEKLAADARAKATPEQLKLFQSMNGHYCYQHYACEWGCDIVGSEVGENINSIQMHIAFTRGAARQYGKPWLIDFSSWYGPSMYDEDSAKHWGDYSGPTRGHSISLHSRTYYAAYMAGANVVVAEGGWLNFFRSQQPGPDGTLPLSTLGEAGARFYQFTKQNLDRGISYTPFALLIDHDHGIYPGFGEKLAWNAFPYTPGDKRILDIWQEFFPNSIDIMQNKDETGYLVESPYGDTLDVITTHASAEVLASYPVILLAGELTDDTTLAPKLRGYVEQGGTLVIHESDTHHPAIEKSLNPPKVDEQPGYTTKKLRNGKIIVYTENPTGNRRGGPPVAAQSRESTLATPDRPLTTILKDLRNQLIPFEITGHVQSLFNRAGRDWLITIINNKGITKTYKEPPIIDPAKTQFVTITSTRTKNHQFKAASGGIQFESDATQAHLSIAPGELTVVVVTNSD
jgi:hypothetical protein